MITRRDFLKIGAVAGAGVALFTAVRIKTLHIGFDMGGERQHSLRGQALLALPPGLPRPRREMVAFRP